MISVSKFIFKIKLNLHLYSWIQSNSSQPLNCPEYWILNTTGTICLYTLFLVICLLHYVCMYTRNEYWHLLDALKWWPSFCTAAKTRDCSLALLLRRREAAPALGAKATSNLSVSNPILLLCQLIKVIQTPCKSKVHEKLNSQSAGNYSL